MNFSRLETSIELRKKQKGFSLMEVMIGIAVSSVLAFMISQMLVNSGKQAASVASKSDFNTFVNQIQGAFNNTGTCLAALGGKGATSIPTDASKFPISTSLKIGAATYAANTTFGGPSTTGGAVSKRALKITKLEFAGANQAAASADQFIVPLNLQVDRSVGTDTATGGNLLSKTFNLIVTLGPAGAGGLRPIMGCAGQYTDFWSSSGDDNIIYSGGKVAIGTCPNGDPNNPLCVDPPQTELDVGGPIQATSFLYRSDLRMKENIRTIPHALDRVLKLHGVLFDWKNHPSQAGKDQLGFIAQDVEKIFPEVVVTHSNGMKAVGYANLLAPIVEAFKEQNEIIARHNEEIADLKQKALKQKENRR